MGRMARCPILPMYDSRPYFPTRHRAAAFLQHYQSTGLVKRCAHADIKIASAWDVEGYVLTCQQDSFEPWHSVVTEVEPANVETFGTMLPFPGCPAGCTYYTPRWREKLSRMRQRWHPFHWFDNQPWQVKVTLVLSLVLAPVVVIALVFRAVDQFVALLQALGALWQKIRG
jgi:hypothetical protein